ncbi:hypothetical protein [Streptomyces umbrinus]|uniref:hypothetical protein n=1 Tax=Streptomyces umbrinus TaxID=67370 RepID=UPI0033E9D0D5
MTEISTEPVAPPAAPTPPPEPSPPREQAPAPSEGRELAHTPGGIPVLPLALSGSNSTIGAVSAAVLAGGGPVAVAVAAGGAAALGAAAVVRARRRSARERRATTSRASNRRDGSSRRASKMPFASRTSGGGSAGRRGRGGAAKSRTSAGGSPRGHGSAAGAVRHVAKHRTPSGRTGIARAASGRSSAAPRGRAGRFGQARALRAANKRNAPNRSAARRQTTADRRQVADARRNAKAANRAAKTRTQGRTRRAAAWTAGKTAAGVRALVNKARTARDRSTGQDVAAKRTAVRKAPARRKARWGLLKSAARFQGRRLLAALVGGTAGVLGCLTTPLGRKLRWRWLMHPGRRLYGRLMLAAREARAERDYRIRAERTAEEAAADAAAAESNDIKDRVERPTHLIPVHAGLEAIHVSGFKFEEAAAEMENAARTYAPDGNMEVLSMIDNLPTALESIAKTFLILAERSDEEFAFEKDVATGFDDIYRTLMNAVDAAGELVPLFRRVHEQDIARHEEPRNGTEAEKGWNV